MMYLANPCSNDAVLDAMRSGQLGYIDTPKQQNYRPPGVPWCADNGCFSDKWDEKKWWQFLVDNAYAAADCLFAVAPDVVGDAWRSGMRSLPWLEKIRALGYPVAWVAQDGQQNHPLPWGNIDVLFIGGTTEFKLGPHARELAREAKARGKRIHVGRVNSERRWKYSAAPYPHGLGADSADGTFLTYGPDVNLPRLLAWTRNNDQPELFGVDA